MNMGEMMNMSTKPTDAGNVSKEPSMADVLMTIAETLRELKAQPNADASIADRLTAMLEAQASKQVEDTMDKAEARKSGRHTGPTGVLENNFPPDISFLNPLGERDNPRPDLKCRIIWAGYEETKEALTREEIELLNRVEPGNYWVTKSDGSKVELKVKAKSGNNGRLEMLRFSFPCKNIEDRMNLRSKVEWLREVLGGPVQSPSELLTELAALRAQLAAR